MRSLEPLILVYGPDTDDRERIVSAFQSRGYRLIIFNRLASIDEVMEAFHDPAALLIADTNSWDDAMHVWDHRDGTSWHDLSLLMVMVKDRINDHGEWERVRFRERKHCSIITKPFYAAEICAYVDMFIQAGMLVRPSCEVSLPIVHVCSARGELRDRIVHELRGSGYYAAACKADFRPTSTALNESTRPLVTVVDACTAEQVQAAIEGKASGGYGQAKLIVMVCGEKAAAEANRLSHLCDSGTLLCQGLLDTSSLVDAITRFTAGTRDERSATSGR